MRGCLLFIYIPSFPSPQPSTLAQLGAFGALYPAGVPARPGHDRERPHKRVRAARPGAAQAGGAAGAGHDPRAQVSLLLPLPSTALSEVQQAEQRAPGLLVAFSVGICNRC